MQDGRLTHRLEIAMSGLMKTLRHLNRSWPRAVGSAFALLCFAASAASVHAASTGPQSLPSPPQVRSQFAIADFDGDRRPDLATVHVAQSSSGDTHYWIAFQLSGGSRQTLGITAPIGGLQLTSRDVNGDHFLHVIITTASTEQPVAVFLNDCRGNLGPSSPSASPRAFAASEYSWACTTVSL